jgi:hypothetical protein
MGVKFFLEELWLGKEVSVVAEDIIIGQDTRRPTTKPPPDGGMKGKTFFAGGGRQPD